jgi:membrane fusion protein (multidrug efflux system)
MAPESQKANPPAAGPNPGSASQETPGPGLRPAEPSPAAPPKRPRRKVFFYVLLAVSLAVGIPYGLKLWTYYQTHESTDDAYVVGDIVPVSSRINGTVESVHADGNQWVESGQLLARLDPRDFEARVAQAKATVDVAAARLRSAEIEVGLAQESTTSDTDRTSATLRGARSSLREAQNRTEEARAQKRTREAAVSACRADVDMLQARLDVAQLAFDRAQRLTEVGVLAKQQFDVAEGELRAARAEWRASQEKLTQAQSEVERCEVDLRAQEQAVEGARAGVAEAKAVLAGSEAQHQSVDIKHAQVGLHDFAGPCGRRDRQDEPGGRASHSGRAAVARDRVAR